MEKYIEPKLRVVIMNSIGTDGEGDTVSSSPAVKEEDGKIENGQSTCLIV